MSPDVKKAEERFKVLKAMDTLVRFINNESAYYNHWIYIIPDDADEDELREIAYEDEETFKDAVECFGRVYPEYYGDGGLYVGGEVY